MIRFAIAILVLSSFLRAAEITEINGLSDNRTAEVRISHLLNELPEPIAFEDTICLLRKMEDIEGPCGKPVRILRRSRGFNYFVLRLTNAQANSFSTGDKVIIMMKKVYGGGSGNRSLAHTGPQDSVKRRVVQNTTIRRRITTDEPSGPRRKVFNISAGVGLAGKSQFLTYSYQLPMQLAVSNEFSFGITPILIKQTVQSTVVSGFGGFGTVTVHFDKFFNGPRLQAGAGFLSLNIDNGVIQAKTSVFAGIGTIGYSSHMANSGLSFDIGLGALYLNNLQNSSVTSPGNFLGYTNLAIGLTF